MIFIKKIYKLLCFNIKPKPKPKPEPKEAYWRALELDYTRELDEYAYDFACDVSGENIKYCQEWACKNPQYAYRFARDVAGADINYCLEACKETGWYAKLQVLIMEEALR